MSPWLRAAMATTLVTLGDVVACGATGSIVTTVGERECILYYGGGGVPDPPKGASSCAPGVCNYQTQTGCSPDESCAPHIDTDKRTVTPACRIRGTWRDAEPCDAERQCGRGLYCVSENETGDAGAFHGFCRTMCCGGDWSACPSGESCIRQANVRFGDDLVYANVDLCFPVGTCDVFDAGSCAEENRTCRVVDPTGAVACAPPSTLAEGAGCDRTHQCGSGLICANAAPSQFTNGTCRKLCRFTACGEPSCSETEGVCVHFDRDPPNAGECTPGWQGTPYVSDGGVLTSPDGSVLRVSDGGVFVSHRL